MARLLQMLPEVEAFERHLIDERRREDGKLRYTPRTAHAYAVAVNKVLHTPTGDFVAALVKAGPVPNWGMIHNAGLAWARWKKDEALTTRLKGIEPPEINYRETRPPTAAAAFSGPWTGPATATPVSASPGQLSACRRSGPPSAGPAPW